MTEINGYKFSMLDDETAMITAPDGKTVAVRNDDSLNSLRGFMLDMARAFVDGKDKKGVVLGVCSCGSPASFETWPFPKPGARVYCESCLQSAKYNDMSIGDAFKAWNEAQGKDGEV